MKTPRKQIERTLNHDFPWLWGIKDFWTFSSDTSYIRVVNADETIMAFTPNGLFGSPDFLPPPDLPITRKVYVHYKNKIGYGTLCVQPEERDSQVCWANKILEATPADSVILNIVLNDDRYGEITLYRMKKHEVTFRELLTQIKRR